MLGFHCDCSCDIDYNRVESSRVVRARKRHQCEECACTIQPGERYERFKGISYDGEAFSFATCLGCRGVRRHFCRYGSIIGQLAEQVRECLGFDYRDDPSEWDQDEVDEEDEDNRRMLAQRKTADTVPPENP